MLAIESLVALVPAAVVAPAEPGSLDVLAYELEVAVLADRLELRARLRVRVDELPDEWTLELSGTQHVKGVAAGEREVPFRHEGGELRLDLSGLSASKELELELTVEGRPYNRFPENQGGHVRTNVDERIAYVRSQYAWYPRAQDDPATYRTVVDAPADWIVQTAGRRGAVEESGGRRSWTFDEEHPARRVGLVAGPYRAVEAEGAGGLALTALLLGDHPESARALLDVARTALELYASRFGELDGESFTLVEMPEEYGAGSGYGESGYVLIGTGAFASADPPPWARAMVAHEVAHAWWGRTVEFEHFASEALAEYSTLRFVEEVEGADLARSMRAKAVEAVLAVASSGREVALADLRSFGRGMDPEVYRVHAYEKGMMVLAMVERAAGREAFDRVLREFLRRRAGDLVSWSDLREALRGAGAAARKVVEQWEVPGIPLVLAGIKSREAGGSWSVEGSLAQELVEKPFDMEVPVVVVCGSERLEQTVRLRGARAGFRLRAPSRPERVLVDPDYWLLVRRPQGPVEDVEAAIERAHQVVGSPGVTDPGRCEETIGLLRSILDSGPGKYEGYCHTGIGRCLFRLGRLEEAKEALEAALRHGAGGPFHRGWVHLRLGNIADLDGRREEALAHYERAREPGSSKTAAAEAAKYAEQPYRR